MADEDPPPEHVWYRWHTDPDREGYWIMLCPLHTWLHTGSVPDAIAAPYSLYEGPEPWLNP